MLRALLSAVILLGLAAVAFLLYSTYFAPERQPASGPGVTSEGRPPAPPAPSAPVAAPLAPEPPVVPLPAPRVEAAPRVPPAPVTPKLKRTHVVQAGESLSSISRRYYGTPDLYGRIVAANGLRSCDLIRVGQVLVIPEASAPPIIETTNGDGEQGAATAAGNQDFEPQLPTLSTTQKKAAVAPRQ